MKFTIGISTLLCLFKVDYASAICEGPDLIVRFDHALREVVEFTDTYFNSVNIDLKQLESEPFMKDASLAKTILPTQRKLIKEVKGHSDDFHKFAAGLIVSDKVTDGQLEVILVYSDLLTASFWVAVQDESYQAVMDIRNTFRKEILPQLPLNPEQRAKIAGETSKRAKSNILFFKDSAPLARTQPFTFSELSQALKGSDNGKALEYYKTIVTQEIQVLEARVAGRMLVVAKNPTLADEGFRAMIARNVSACKSLISGYQSKFAGQNPEAPITNNWKESIEIAKALGFDQKLIDEMSNLSSIRQEGPIE